MASSQQLRLGELRRLYLLVGECCELGADPIAWRRHLVQQLPDLFRGEEGRLVEVKVISSPVRDSLRMYPLMVANFGWRIAGDCQPVDAHTQANGRFEGRKFSVDLHDRKQRGPLSIPWSDDLDRTDWPQSLFLNDSGTNGDRHIRICAHDVIEPGQIRWLFVNRAAGGRPFSGRECRLLDLLNEELTRLLETKLARLSKPSMTDLPRRLREVLVCLMEGDSEKQVAVRLDISRHTVHDYVKQLHARFRVRSRAELLSRCRAYWPVLKSLESTISDGRNGRC